MFIGRGGGSEGGGEGGREGEGRGGGRRMEWEGEDGEVFLFRIFAL